MLFDNLDYNFSPHQHMFKKAKELSDEKVFLLISSNHITIYNETASSFSKETKNNKSFVAGEHCSGDLRDDWQAHQEAGLRSGQVWIRDEGFFKNFFFAFSSLIIDHYFVLIDHHFCSLIIDHHFVQDKGRMSQTESEEEEVVNKKKMKDKKKKGVKEEDNKKKKKAKKVMRQIDIARSHNVSPSKVENLTTPLISYVGSGVPQEVLDMPVDPNEPTYCTCQQVMGTNDGG